jgi:hypothetical protein
VSNELVDCFDVEPGKTRSGDNVADIQGRHGLIPVTEDGARELIEKLQEIHDLEAEIDTTGENQS